MLALCWHSIPAYYAFYYVGIFDAGLTAIRARHTIQKRCLLKVALSGLNNVKGQN